MTQSLDDNVLMAHQWVANWAYTQRDDVSPWLLASWCAWGSVICSVGSTVYEPGLFRLFVTSVLIWLASKFAKHVYRMHTKWLNGRVKYNPISYSPEHAIMRFVFFCMLIPMAIFTMQDHTASMMLSYLTLNFGVCAQYFNSCEPPQQLDNRQFMPQAT